MLNASDSVAGVVLNHPECAEVFQRHRIDFCCRGDASVERAAEERGIPARTLIGELEAAIATRAAGAPASVKELPTPALIDHIVDTHHLFLRRALPVVRQLAAKVARVHGDRNPQLRDVDAAVSELSASLLAHIDEEEQTLFPALMSADQDPIALMEALEQMAREHFAVAALLERIRRASDDYVLPDWACNSYRALFSELQALERDVFTHVHLENHVLKPRFDESPQRG